MITHRPYDDMRPRRRGGVAATALMALLLSGCASFGPDNLLKVEETVVEARKGVPSRADWSTDAPDAPPREDWVDSFGDGLLPGYVDNALLRNTDIVAALAAIDAAAANVDVAKAAKLPSLGATAGVSRTQRIQRGTITQNGIDFPVGDLGNFNLSTGINASWEPDFWNRIRDQIEGGELNLAASADDLEAARLSIAGQVSQAYFDLIEAKLLVGLAEREIETQERALRLTQRRFEGGVTGSSDVRLARSQVASAQASLATRLQQRDATARRLEVLIRTYPEASILAADDLPTLPSLTGAGVPADVLSRRPDLRAQERRLEAQGLQVDLARKALLPRLSLTGGVSASGRDFDQFFDLESLVGQLASNLTAPIFQGGRLKAGVARQEAVLRQQLERYAGSALQAYREIEDALDAETRLAEREAALRVSLDEARRAEERLERRYIEGLATILQLLDAQSRRISAEGQLIAARAERLASRVRLHVALGGTPDGLVGSDLTASNLTASNLINDISESASNATALTTSEKAIMP